MQVLQKCFFLIFSLIEFNRYITVIYFAVTTMLTVGYGDISAVSPLEKLFCTLTILITCCVFAYTMNVIGNIIESHE